MKCQSLGSLISYPHWNQDYERWLERCQGLFFLHCTGKVYGAFAIFFVLIVKAKEKNRNQLLGDVFSKKSSYASTGMVFILLVEYILKERNNMGFWKELMNSFRTVSKQSAALCVI